MKIKRIFRIAKRRVRDEQHGVVVPGGLGRRRSAQGAQRDEGNEAKRQHLITAWDGPACETVVPGRDAVQYTPED